MCIVWEMKSSLIVPVIVFVLHLYCSWNHLRVWPGCSKLVLCSNIYHIAVHLDFVQNMCFIASIHATVSCIFNVDVRNLLRLYLRFRDFLQPSWILTLMKLFAWSARIIFMKSSYFSCAVNNKQLISVNCLLWQSTSCSQAKLLVSVWTKMSPRNAVINDSDEWSTDACLEERLYVSNCSHFECSKLTTGTEQYTLSLRALYRKGAYHITRCLSRSSYCEE
jgi:hypothetical protein